MTLTRACLIFTPFLILMSGCSLIFNGGEYEGDAGTMDGGAVDDAGVDAGVDAGGVTCSSHADCRRLNNDAYYVCVPRGARGTLICAADCQAPMDCRGLGGHDDGDVCDTTGGCGCRTSADCSDPDFPVCDAAGQCQPLPTCAATSDCMMTGVPCYLGLCQTVSCVSPSECVEEPARTQACVGPPGARVCADHCIRDENCASNRCNSGTCTPP